MCHFVDFGAFLRDEPSLRGADDLIARALFLTLLGIGSTAVLPDCIELIAFLDASVLNF